MKRLFYLMTICAMALMTSCDNGVEQGNTAHLKVTSPTLFDVETEGGNVAITYQISNPIEGATVTTNVLSGSEVIGSISQPAVGVILVAITPNSTDAERTAAIEVRYDSDAVTVVITQKAGSNSGGNAEYDVTFNAYILNGYYYGQKYGEGSDRYVFYLSQSGLNNAGQAYPNSEYYYIDAFGPVATGGAPYTVANGTYFFDADNTGNPYTFTAANSQYFQSTDSDIIATPITGGKIVVNGNNITLDVVIDGLTHHVTFSNHYELTDVTEDNGGNNGGGGGDDPTGGQEKDAQSTLTGDHVITFPDTPRAKWIYEGDWWKTGYSNYTIMIMNKYNGVVTGDTLQLDIITDNTSNDGDFYGTYTCSYTPGKNVMMAGFTDNQARPVGCWYFEYGGGSGYKNYAMLIKGSATITDNGDGTSTVILDAYDCNNNHITCNWTGVIEKE